jgi:endonuclease/exonuclease/phosphatase family metal-dependent hydrolase
MKSILWVISLGWLAMAACDDGAKTTAPPTELTMGTWNVQFLADRLDAGEIPRTAADVAALVRVITDGGFGVLAVEEILGADSLGLLQAHGLGAAWRLEVGASGGSQKLGVLWDSGVIDRVEDVRELDNDDGLIPADWSGLRYPLHARIVVRGGFAFTMVVVHLKAGITNAGASQRARQVDQLAAWAAGHEGPLAIMGDYNDTFEGILEGVDSLAALEGSDAGRFLTADLPEGAFTSLEFLDLIDHVFLSPDLDARVVPGSLGTIDFDLDAANAGVAISDHRPVRFTIGLQ